MASDSEGNQCKYIHANARPTQTSARPPQARPLKPKTLERSDQDSKFRSWQALLLQRNAHFVTVNLADFFRMGSELVNDDPRQTAQMVIKKLATEQGLGTIKALTEKMREGESDVTFFRASTLPLFQMISHPDVCSSLILESEVDTIFNFLFGPAGRRATIVFRHCTLTLLALTSNALEVDSEVSDAVSRSLAVLEKVVELNQSAQVNPDLIGVVRDLFTIPPRFLQAEQRYVRRIAQRLSLDDNIPWAQKEQKTVSQHVPLFQIKEDLPGELSQSGSRHDNDFVKISDIGILPTGSEILSTRNDFLPSNDSSQHHLSGLARLLDRQFRLLREDCIGQLKDAIRIEHEKLSASRQKLNMSKPQNNIRSNTYHAVNLLRFQFDYRHGLQIMVEFDQVQHLQKKNTKERENWWTNTKSLQIGSLLCLVSSTGRFIFCLVCDPRPSPARQNTGKHRNDDEDLEDESEIVYHRHLDQPPSLFHDARRATLLLSLACHEADQVSWLHEHMGKPLHLRMCLVEFPGILLASFKPMLEALQKMSCTLDVPFSELIAPEEGLEATQQSAPLYALKPGFSYDLSYLADRTPLTLRPGMPFDFATLQKTSALDQAQQHSTIDALSRSLALIQGPPGTGKSFTGVAIIKALLENRSQAKLGPIVCICYTNHALDQLLEHLIKQGVRQLVRMGSRSKSEIVRGFNLHEISKRDRPSRSENYEKFVCFERIDELSRRIGASVLATRESGSWSSIKEYLESHHHEHYRQLCGGGVDADGFREVKKKRFNVLSGWLHNAPSGITSERDIAELVRGDLMKMSAKERKRLLAHWMQQVTASHSDRLNNLLGSYHESRQSLHTMHRETDLRCLLNAHVVGVTTTGLAQNLDLLRRLRARVVVIEEAGEVLEAHTLAAFMPSIEHAILIGDHQQLRPQINTYEFQHDHPRGAKYSLDVSLFERLVNPHSGGVKVPYSSLEIQRRMHPSIAELVRSTLYPRLKDHSSVSLHPEVVGMRKRLFWLDHDHKEDAQSSNSAHNLSKTNVWEVDMVASLVSHLVQQGKYQSDDIAVLTPYLGQLQKLKQRLGSTFAIVVGDRDQDDLAAAGIEGEDEVPAKAKFKVERTSLRDALRIASVDNFQGEEAKVIVISLVRCNDEKKCGFLKTSNRINVLLSRAQHGMYIIGSVETARPVDMWDQVITILDEGDNVGKSLALCCPRHLETVIEVSKPDDFAVLAPEGGCNRRCPDRLSCGHACINKCHSDPLHNAVRCLERCQRIKDGCDHACPKLCGDPCDVRCQTTVTNIQLPCGHIEKSLKCHLAQTPESVRCQAEVEVSVSGCQHLVKVRCYQLPLQPSFKCPVTCNAPLQCGHDCPKTCHQCNKREEGKINIIKTDHGVCAVLCGRKYTLCRHACSQICHGEEACQPCPQPCEACCSHSKCNKLCHEPCAPCIEICSWSCPHNGKCDLPCAVPCSLLPCSKRCLNKLSCDHQCPSVCGEVCPSPMYCQICSKPAIQDLEVDYILGETYSSVNLDENPCIIPACGHILTLESMDGHMDMQKHYQIEEADSNDPLAIGGPRFTGLKTLSTPFSVAVKNCPQCRGPLLNINRYGRIVRRAWIDEATKKFISWANAAFIPLSQRMETVETDLTASAPPALYFQAPNASENPSPLEPLVAEMRSLTLEPPSFTFNGPRDAMIRQLTSHLRIFKRYNPIIALRKNLTTYLAQVSEREQPISRIRDMVADARRHRGLTTTAATALDLLDLPAILQTRSRLLATLLSLRCDYALLYDAVRASTSGFGGGPNKIDLDLGAVRDECERLSGDAESKQQHGIRAEAWLYWVRYLGLERRCSSILTAGETAGLVERGIGMLGEIRKLRARYPGSMKGITAGEVLAAERMVSGGTFYEPVTVAEKSAVVLAMATEFRGTGHWYFCSNGHPFTIGECGMPMERARCPQCGGEIGGEQHRMVEGVRHARDLEI